MYSVDRCPALVVCTGYQNQGPPPATLITSLLSLDNEVFLTGTNDGAIRCWSIA